MKLIMTLVSLFFIMAMPSAFSEEGLTVVAVGQAEVEQDKMTFAAISVPSNASAAEKKVINELQKLIQNDFAFYRQRFETVTSSGYESLISNNDFSKMKAKGLRYYITSSFQKSLGGQLSAELKLYGVHEEKVLEDVQVIFNKSNVREKGHIATDFLFQKIAGETSIFRSKIIFVSDVASGVSKDVKELYIMDFDGFNKRRLTHHRGTVISPAFSFDGKKVLYSLIKNTRSKHRNVNLLLLDIETGKSKVVSSRKGINSGAVFMPDGKHIALTLSHEGNAELYALNTDTGATRRITKHYAPDVDPSINVSGTKVAFLSGRSGSGKPMIYIADPRGQEKAVKRISYVGKYNATPRFSPDGSQIAFASWLDNRFDIFRVDENGDNLYRLTKDFGSNEDPTYSNDGQFIAFSSQRVLSQSKAVQNIYIMTADGDILGQVTENFGNCSTPRWSKF